MSSPRILEIFNRYQLVGGEEIAANRMFDLLGERYEIERCLFSSSEWTQPGAPSRWRQAFLMFRNPGSLERIREAHDRFRPDCWLVHNVFPVASAAVFELAGELGVPIVYVCHNYRPFSVNGYCWAGDKIAPGGLRKNYLAEILAGSWQNSRIKTAIFALILRRLHSKHWLDSVGAWLAISDFVRDRFVEAGIPEDKIHTLRHSWDLINPAPPENSQGQYFLYLGRLSVEKGLRVLLETWKQLTSTLGANAPLLKICGEGPLQHEVEEFAALCPKVEFVGVVSGQQKHELLKGCVAVIVPSIWWEALGLVTYEAYDFGKPVLAAASGGLSETVQHGITGFLHTPGNASQLADQVVELWNNPEPATEMGRNGRLWLEQNTAKEEWLAGFGKLLKKLKGREPRVEGRGCGKASENPKN